MNDLLKQLTELVPLAEAATAGPWRASDTGEADEDGRPWLGLEAAKDFWFRPTPFPVPNRPDRPNNTLPSNDLLCNITLTTQAFRNGADTAFIAAARNVLTPKNLTALCAALAPVADWVSTTTPPAPCDSPNGPAPFSPDVLIWLNDNEAPVVGYYDYRAGYDCYQAYGLGIVDSATHWALIVPPTAPATMEGAQPHV